MLDAAMPRVSVILPMPFFSHAPTVAGALTLNVFGPRPGEAPSLALPDQSWVVTDSCLEGAENVTSHLLRRWEAE